MTLPPRWILLMIVFFEGFAVLAAELLAIRQIIPYTGSGTDTISIIIAAVLLPLAIGNFMGGRFVRKKTFLKFTDSVRNKLIFNLLISMTFFTAGLSYVTLNEFFNTLFLYGIDNRHVVCVLYGIVFLAFPVYLLGQTLPLISFYFNRSTVQKAAGTILFFSTAGAFMGSVFCTMALMAIIGVSNTVIVLIVTLSLLIVVLSKKKISIGTFAAGLLVALTVSMNHPGILANDYVVANNEYHKVQIIPENADETIRTMRLNGNQSARFAENEANMLEYQRYVEDLFFKPLRFQDGPPKEILVIGAGGFMLGRTYNRPKITYIDIDPDLLKISEEHLLREKLGKNKEFIPLPARAFLTQITKENKQFDMIVLDAYQGNMSLPEHLVTQDFYLQVKQALKPDGIMVGNFHVSPHFSDVLSVRIDNTIRSVFPNFNRHVYHTYDGWNTNPEAYRNTIYVAYNKPVDTTIYTDNLNPAFYDKNRAHKGDEID